MHRYSMHGRTHPYKFIHAINMHPPARLRKKKKTQNPLSVLVNGGGGLLGRSEPKGPAAALLTDVTK